MNLQIPVSELQKYKIQVATPMYGGQCFGSYTKSLLDLSRAFQSYGINSQFSFIFNESLITRARNYLVDEFLRSDATHLMFIDSDIEFNPMDVIALLAVKKPIVGGPYPKKCIAWENVYDAARFGLVPGNDRGKLADYAGDFVFNTVPGTKQIQLNEPVEVLEIGTGFMMVEREVFTKFAEAYPQYWYNPDHNRSASFDGSRKIYQYFQAEIVPTEGMADHSRYLSEDYWFCQKARDIGVGVWFAPWMQIRHHGTYIYTGGIPAMAQVINERISRNEPVPAAVQVSTKSNGLPTPVRPNVSEFYGLPAAKRTEYLTALSSTMNVSVDQLQSLYKEHRDTWLKETPQDLLEECFRRVMTPPTE